MYKWIAFTSLIIWLCIIDTCLAVEVTCLEQNFIRGDGQPITETVVFPCIAGPATVKIYNGADDDSYEKVSSTIISINGIDVIKSDSFNQTVSYLETSTSLIKVENKLSVQLKGKPGSTIKIQISQKIDAEAADFIGAERSVIKVTDISSEIFGTSIEIADNIFTTREFISIGIEDNPPTVPLPTGLTQEGPVIKFESSKTIFDKPVLMKIPFIPNENPNVLRLVYTFNEETNSWEQVPPFPSPNKNEFWGLVYHFSDYVKGTATIDDNFIRSSFLVGRDSLRYRNNRDVGPDNVYNCQYEDPDRHGICAGIGMLASYYFNNFAGIDENEGLTCRWDLITSAEAACEAFNAYKSVTGLNVADIFNAMAERISSYLFPDSIEYSFLIDAMKDKLSDNTAIPLVLKDNDDFHFVIVIGWKKTGLFSGEFQIYDVNDNTTEGKIKYFSIQNGPVLSMEYVTPYKIWTKFYLQDSLFKIDVRSIIEHRPTIDENNNGIGDSCETQSFTVNGDEDLFENSYHQSVFSIISNLKNNTISADSELYKYLKDHSNPNAAELQDDGSLFISYWLDSTWNDSLNISNSFNTVYKLDSGIDEDGIFEVISAGDEEGSERGTYNDNAYYFSYDSLNDSIGESITLTQWVDYLKGVKNVYQPIGRLTIFTHGSYGTIKFSDNAILTLETVSNPEHEHHKQLKRLKDEGIITNDAHILLFSCLVGGSQDGQELVRKIAELTGAYVHANSEYTGNKVPSDLWLNYSINDVGIDWDLNIVCNYSGCVDNATYSMLAYPQNGSLNLNPVDIDFVWKPSNNAQEYCLVINEYDYQNNSTFYRYCGLDTHAMRTSLDYGKNYTWQISAKNEFGDIIESSQQYNFTTMTNPLGTDTDKDGFSTSGNPPDCDDTNNEVYPGALEICGDTIDQDCNGVAETCVVPITDYKEDFNNSINPIWSTEGTYSIENGMLHMTGGIDDGHNNSWIRIQTPNKLIQKFDADVYVAPNKEQIVGIVSQWGGQTSNGYTEMQVSLKHVNGQEFQASLGVKSPTGEDFTYQENLGPASTGEWHHLSITLNNDHVIFGINGVETKLFCGLYANPNSVDVGDAYVHGHDSVDHPDYYVDNIVAVTSALPLVLPPTPNGIAAEFDKANNWNWITWNNIQTPFSYNLYWGTEPDVTQCSEFAGNTPSTEFSHTGMSPGWSYYYRIAAVDADGNESPLSDVVGVGETIPQNIQASYQSLQQYNYITWNEVPGATEYHVYWGTSSIVTTGSEPLTATTTLDYAHTGVLPGWTYFYRVAALVDGVESELSVVIPVYVPLSSSDEEIVDYFALLQHFYPDDHYAIGMGYDENVSSVSVDGPNILEVTTRPTSLSVDLTSRPALGAQFNFHFTFEDGSKAKQTYTVTAINDNYVSMLSPRDGTSIKTTSPTFTWEANTNSEWLEVIVSDSTGIIWWSPSFPKNINSCIYNSDGTATAPLEVGEMYGIQLNYYDYNNNQASTNSSFFVTYDRPTVKVEPSIGSKSAKTLLNEPVFAFTPNTGVTLHFIDPTGYDNQIHRTTDSYGNYPHFYTCYEGTLEGRWTYYAEDDTGKRSDPIFFDIVP